MLRDLKFARYTLTKRQWLKLKGEDQVFKASQTVVKILEESSLLSFFVLEKRNDGSMPIAFYDENKEKLWPLSISGEEIILSQKEVVDELQKDIFRDLVRKAFVAGIIKK